MDMSQFALDQDLKAELRRIEEAILLKADRDDIVQVKTKLKGRI